MRQVVIAGAVLALIGMARPAAGEIKVAVVDMGVLLEAHPDRKSADELLEKQADEFKEEKNELLARFKEMKQAFEDARLAAENKALSEAGREKKREEAREKLEDLQVFDREVRETTLKRQKQLADQSDRMRRRVVKRLREIVGDYARDNEYDLVLDTANRGLSAVESVVFAAPELDITEAVVEIVRKDGE